MWIADCKSVCLNFLVPKLQLGNTAVQKLQLRFPWGCSQARAWERGECPAPTAMRIAGKPAP